MAGITLKETAAASVPTPDAGKDSIFFDSADGLPKYKDDTGTVTTIGSGSAITALTGDVTATGPGSVAATLATAQPGAHTWAATQTFTLAPVFTDANGTRTALGLAIGTDVQAYDAQLSDVAALSYAGNALKVMRVNAGETAFELATVSAGSGDVVGPGSSTDNALARFDSTTGKLIQSSLITVSDNGALTIAGATITADEPLLNLAQTLNNGAVSFTAIKLNLTDTASAAGTLLFDFQVGAVSKIKGRKDGKLTIGTGSYNDAGLDFAGSGGISYYLSGLYFLSGPTTSVAYMSDGVRVKLGGLFGWSNNPSFPNNAADTLFCRVAAAIIGVRGASTSAGGALEFIEQTAPSAGATNSVRIYAQDNGSGKTQLMALFPTGAAQQLAIEP